MLGAVASSVLGSATTGSVVVAALYSKELVVFTGVGSGVLVTASTTFSFSLVVTLGATGVLFL